VPERIGIQVGEHAGALAARHHRDLGRTLGAAAGVGHAPLRHRETAAAIGSAHRGSTKVGYDFLHRAAIGIDPADPAHAVLVVTEVEAASLAIPGRRRDVMVEAGGQHARAAAREVKHMQLRLLVTQLAIVESDVGKALAIRRQHRIDIGTIARGERHGLAAVHIHAVDLSFDRLELPIRIAIGHHVERLAIAAPQRPAMVEIALRHLARRATFGGQHEHLIEARLDVTGPVEAVAEPIDQLHFGRPLRAFRLGRQAGERLGLACHLHRERKAATIRRPREPTGRLGELGQYRGLSGIHPAQPDLGRTVARGNPGDAAAIGRPHRGAVAARPAGQRPVSRAVGVQQPQMAAAAILHDVELVALVHDALAVRRQRRIVGPLQIEHVARLQCQGIDMQVLRRRARAHRHADQSTRHSHHVAPSPNRRSLGQLSASGQTPSVGESRHACGAVVPLPDRMPQRQHLHRYRARCRSPLSRPCGRPWRALHPHASPATPAGQLRLS
jgi:hypothetical protein